MSTGYKIGDFAQLEDMGTVREVYEHSKKRHSGYDYHTAAEYAILETETDGCWYAWFVASAEATVNTPDAELWRVLTIEEYNRYGSVNYTLHFPKGENSPSGANPMSNADEASRVFRAQVNYWYLDFENEQVDTLDELEAKIKVARFFVNDDGEILDIRASQRNSLQIALNAFKTLIGVEDALEIIKRMAWPMLVNPLVNCFRQESLFWQPLQSKLLPVLGRIGTAEAWHAIVEITQDAIKPLQAQKTSPERNLEDQKIDFEIQDIIDEYLSAAFLDAMWGSPSPEDFEALIALLALADFSVLDNAVLEAYFRPNGFPLYHNLERLLLKPADEITVPVFKKAIKLLARIETMNYEAKLLEVSGHESLVLDDSDTTASRIMKYILLNKGFEITGIFGEQGQWLLLKKPGLTSEYED